MLYDLKVIHSPRFIHIQNKGREKFKNISLIPTRLQREGGWTFDDFRRLAKYCVIASHVAATPAVKWRRLKMRRPELTMGHRDLSEWCCLGSNAPLRSHALFNDAVTPLFQAAWPACAGGDGETFFLP